MSENEAVATQVTPITYPVDHSGKVAIYENGWEWVDKASRDFPIIIKMVITPEWAKDVLDTRNKINRPIKKRRVDKYARDILTGNYKLIHQGIAFYEDGSLSDGQHRLKAIVQSNLPVKVFVAFGLDKESGKVIDEGTSRSDRDVAHLSGLELSASFVSTANFLIETMGYSYTRLEKQRFYEKHRDAINFACNNLTRKNVSRAPVLAAVAKAYYTQPRMRLIEFLDAMQTGQYKGPADDGAYRLREFTIDNTSRSDGNFRRELYDKTMTALEKFIKGEPLDRLYAAKNEPFLLPEEVELKKEQTFINRSNAMREVRSRPQKRVVVEGTPVQDNSTEPTVGYGG